MDKTWVQISNLHETLVRTLTALDGHRFVECGWFLGVMQAEIQGILERDSWPDSLEARKAYLEAQLKKAAS